MTEIQLILVIGVTLICFYAVVKLHSLYKKTDELKYIGLLALVLLVATDTWISFYGRNVKEFFDKYRFLFTFIPLLVYLLFMYFDSKRKKEENEKKKIKDAFQRYVQPAVIEEILADPRKLKLGGEKKSLAILFSDIRGFTALSEKLSPEELVHMLNQYFTKMADLIIDRRGVLDKFIGDAIMAFWGAPLKEPYESILSCESAKQMVIELEELNKEFKKQGLPEIKTGIGINSGEVVVGNVGSDTRFNYTVLGDHVNLASRIEGLTKFYGADILVSETINS